jgi:hypothetical protein
MPPYLTFKLHMRVTQLSSRKRYAHDTAASKFTYPEVVSEARADGVLSVMSTKQQRERGYHSDICPGGIRDADTPSARLHAVKYYRVIALQGVGITDAAIHQGYELSLTAGSTGVSRRLRLVRK